MNTQSIKRALVAILAAAGLLGGASAVSVLQLRAPIKTTASLLVTLPGGQVVQGAVAGATFDGIGNLILPPPATTVLPSISYTTVTSSTPNSFPIPTGKTACTVDRNIVQVPGVDYNVTAGNVVFVQTPEIGDSVRLVCY